MEHDNYKITKSYYNADTLLERVAKNSKNVCDLDTALKTTVTDVNTAIATAKSEVEDLVAGQYDSFTISIEDSKNAISTSSGTLGKSDVVILYTSSSLYDLNGNKIDLANMKVGDFLYLKEEFYDDGTPVLDYFVGAKTDTTLLKLCKNSVSAPNMAEYTKKSDFEALEDRVDTVEATLSSSTTAYDNATTAYNNSKALYDELSPKVANLDKKIDTTLTKEEYEALTDPDDDTFYMYTED